MSPAAVALGRVGDRNVSTIGVGFLERRKAAVEEGVALAFLGTPASDSEIKDAVDFAAYENLKKLETKKAFRGSRLIPGDKKNPDSFKVRRAKVGGYRDYFDDQQIAQIEELVRASMLPDFGYGGEWGAALAARA